MRISCTLLESFRLWRDGDWMPESELIASIKGEAKASTEMALGASWGRILEDPQRWKIDDGYECGAYAFAEDVIGPAIDLIDHRGIFEAKATKAYGPHLVVAKADYLYGLDLQEFKTTLGTYDADKYLESNQWRFMADIFQPSRITYHTFCLSQDQAGIIRLRSIETLRLYSYAELHSDCCALLREFVSYVYHRQLQDFLKDKDAIVHG